MGALSTSVKNLNGLTGKNLVSSESFANLLEVAKNNDAKSTIKTWKKAGADNNLIRSLVGKSGQSNEVSWSVEDGLASMKDLGMSDIPQQADKAKKSLSGLNKVKLSNITSSTKELGTNIKSTLNVGLDNAKKSVKSLGSSLKNAFGGIGAIIKANLPIAAITVGVAAVAKGISTISNKVQSNRKKQLNAGRENIEEYRADIESYENKINEVKSIRDEFNKLSSGVDNRTNKNIGLTNDEYERYLDLKEKLISINDDVISSYDSEGNALINNQTAIDSTISKYEKLIDKKKEALVSDENLAIQNMSTKANATKTINGAVFSDAGILDNIARSMPAFMRTKSNFELNGILSNRSGFKSSLQGLLSTNKSDIAKLLGMKSDNVSAKTISNLSDAQLNKIAKGVSDLKIKGDLFGTQKDEIEKYAYGFTQNYKEMESVVEEFKEGTLTNLVQASEGYDKLDSTTKTFADNFVKNMHIDSSKLTTNDGIEEVENRVKDIMKTVSSDKFSKGLSDFYSLTSSTSLRAGEWQKQIDDQFDYLSDITGLSKDELSITLGVEFDDGHVLTSSGKSVGSMIDNLSKKFGDSSKKAKEYFSSLSLDKLSTAYDLVIEKNEIFTGSLDQLKRRLDLINEYQSSGLSYTIDDYTAATQTSDSDADYNTFVSGLKQTKSDYDSGKVGTDQFRTMAGLISPTGKTDDKNFIKNYEKIKKYFTEDNTGTNRFLKDLSKQTDSAGKSLAKLDKTTGKYKINIKDTASLAKKFGMGLQPFEAMLNNLKTYGHNVSFESLIAEYEEVDGYLDQWSKKWKDNGGVVGDEQGQGIEAWKQRIQEAKTAGESIPDEWVKIIRFEVENQEAINDLKNERDNYKANEKQWTVEEENKSLKKQAEDANNIMYDIVGNSKKVETGTLTKDIEYNKKQQKELQTELDNYYKAIENYNKEAKKSNPDQTKLNDFYNKQIDSSMNFLKLFEKYSPEAAAKFGIEVTGLASIDEVKTKLKDLGKTLEGDSEKGYSVKLKADDTEALQTVKEWNEQHPESTITIKADDAEAKNIINSLRTQYGNENMVMNVDADTADAMSKIEGVSVMKIGDKYVAIYGKGSEAENEVKKIDGIQINDKKFTITAVDFSKSTVKDLQNTLSTLDSDLKIKGNATTGYTIKVTADDTEALSVLQKWNAQHPDVPISITCDDSEASSIISSLQNEFGDKNYVVQVDADTADAMSKIEGVSVMKIGDKYVAIYGKNSDAVGKINGIIGSNIPSKTFGIFGNDNATPTLNGVSSYTINGKTFTITATDQSTGTLGTIQSMIAGIKDKSVNISVTKTVTTIQNTVRRITDVLFGRNSARGTASFASGTAFASGSIPKLGARALALGSLSYANGKDIGADKSETSLVGELGAEMRIPAGTNRWELIGQHGAEFVKVRRGDIIFNHQQTQSLLKSGRTSGRAKVHGGSSAFAHGTTSYAKGTSGTAYASGTKQSAIEKYAESVGNRFDFVAIKLDRLAQSVDSFANQINDFVSATTKTTALWNQYNAVGKEISGQKSAQSRYSKEASDIRSGALKKVSKSQRKTLDTYFTRVRNGGFNINTINDDGMRQIVQDYQEAYDKMLDCKYAVQELQNEQRELFNQWLDMPLEEAQQKVDKLADSYSTLSSQMNLVSSGGSAMEILSYHEQWHINSANRNNETSSWKNQLKNNILVGTSYLDKPAYEYQNKLLSDSVTNTTNQVNTYINALRKAEKNYAKYNKSGSSTQKADAKRALDELQAKVNQAAVDAAQARIDFALNSHENIKNYFDSQYSYLEGALNKSEKLFDLKEAKGIDVTDVEYEDRLNAIMDLRQNKLEEQAQMQKNLDDQIKKGYITKGTQEYYELQSEIDAVGQEVTDLDISAEELKDTMRDDLFFRSLERAQKAAENLQNSLETISDLIDEDAFFDDKGNVTKYGEAYLASNVANIKSTKDTLKNLLKERETINKLFDEGYYSETEYTEKVQENQENIADAVQSIKSAENTVISLITDNAQAKIDATNDMIDAYKKALQSEKDYYEYDKDLKSSNKEIQQLQNQIAALNGVADAASRAEKARLEEQLQDAMDSRDDTIKDHIYTLKVDGLDDLSDMLDDNYEKYIKELAQDISKIEEALNDVTNSIHSSSSDILKTWEEILNHYGISGSDLGLTDSNLTGFASGGLVKAVRKNGDSGIASLKSGEEVVVADTVRFAGEILPKLKSVITNPSIPENSLLNDFKPSVDLNQLQSNNELNIHYDNLMEIQKIEGLADMSERDLQKLMESCYKYTNENIIKSVTKRLGIKRQI